MYPEYSGPADPQLHKVYVQSCRRQGLVPRARPSRNQSVVANVVHDRNRAPAYDAHCATNDLISTSEYDNDCWDAEQEEYAADLGSGAAWMEPAYSGFGDEVSGGDWMNLPSYGDAVEGPAGSEFPGFIDNDTLWAAHVTSDQEYPPPDDAPSLSTWRNHPANLIANVTTRAQLRATQEASADNNVGVPNHATEPPPRSSVAPPPSATSHSSSPTVPDTSIAAAAASPGESGSPSVTTPPTEPTQIAAATLDGLQGVQEASSNGMPFGGDAAGSRAPGRVVNAPTPSSDPVSFSVPPTQGELPHPTAPFFRNGYTSRPTHAFHPSRLGKPAAPGGSLLPGSAQHWVTIAQLLRVADHPHILRLLRSHQSAYKPVSHPASSTMGAAPVSLVEWQSYSIPVGPEIYNLCINPVPSSRAFGRTAPSRTPASISINIDSTTATPRLYQLLRDVTSQLESDLHGQDPPPTANLTKFVFGGHLPAKLQSASVPPKHRTEKFSVSQIGTPVTALLRTHPVEQLTGMSGWDLHKRIINSKAAVFTLPKTEPSDGFSLVCPNVYDEMMQVSPDLAFMRKHNLKCLRYDGALDTSAGGTSARIIGHIPRMKMVMKHKTVDELVVHQNMYVIAGSNPLFEVILGTPALLAMGAFTDPLLSTFFYRPRWQSSADLQHIVGVPAKVALACLHPRSANEHAVTTPHILAWREKLPMSLVTNLPSEFNLASLTAASDEEECPHLVALSDDDHATDTKECDSASCVADICKLGHQPSVATSCTSSEGTITSMFCHETLYTPDYTCFTENDMADVAPHDSQQAQQPDSPVMHTPVGSAQLLHRTRYLITPEPLLRRDPSIVPELLALCQCRAAHGPCPSRPAPSPSIVRDLFGVGGPLHVRALPGGADHLPPNNDNVDHPAPSPPSSLSVQQNSSPHDSDGEPSADQSVDTVSTTPPPSTSSASSASSYAVVNMAPPIMLAIMMVIHMLWLFGLVALTFGFVLWMGRR
jgi:hypothetical protein